VRWFDISIHYTLIYVNKGAFERRIAPKAAFTVDARESESNHGVMQDDERTKSQLISELRRVRAEGSRLLGVNQELQAAAAEERDERSNLTASETAQSRGEVARFKVEVTEQLKTLTLDQLQSTGNVKHVPIGIAYLDKNLLYRWANPTFTELLDSTYEQVVNQPFLKVFPEASEKLVAMMAADPANPTDKQPFVYSFVGGDDATHWDLLVLPLTGEDRNVEVILVAIEVTERVEQVDRQKQQIEKLIQLDQLKDDAISAVSHELRTPLTTIAGYAEFLEDNIAGPLTTDQRGFVTQIQEAEGRIRRIVDDLLDFARIEAGTFKLQFEIINLIDLMHEVMAAMLPQTEKANLTAHLSVPSQPLFANVDRQRIGQVILNLLSNAIKFTPAGGSINVLLYETSGHAHISIEDSGIGIDACDLPRVFERFYQVTQNATRKPAGAGLGLAISKTLLELHGGQLHVKSEPGSGSVFSFTLPLASQALPPKTP
jgi:signal transduction histidine kinase